MHDHGILFVEGSLCDLCISSWRGIVSVSDQRQLNSVRAVVVDLGLEGAIMLVLVIVLVSVVGIGAWGSDIVMGVAIVWDQGATILVAGQLNFTGVDVLHWSDNWLSIDLDDGLVCGNSGSSDLWVDIVGWLDVTARVVKLNTVGALWRAIVYIIISTVVVVVVSLAEVWVDDIIVVLAAIVIASATTAIEVVSVLQLGIAAGQDGRASVVHLGSEGELLAVENESGTVLIELRLSPLALITALSILAIHFSKSVPIGLLVLINVIIVLVVSPSAVVNLSIHSDNIVADVAHGGLECLKRHKHLSLDLDSLLVVVLIPNLIPLIEAPNLSVEVGTWELLTVFLRVIWLDVVIANGEAWLGRGMVIATLSNFDGIGSVGACSEGDSEFHNFIFKF